ncbi:MAG: lysophospholipid acyltransferase family protein [Desulfitobacteriaceae bacterium]|nr:lysophospholipid acyltransferase family protein [Desulfitobacteriaceae bacterium]MDD4346948.1 lysophospholipid acyltransferase family protein [Desulfitobacteriaceae bacterium]MDD4402212.1 lysophospholipid acyltransferase family protein [Desulfitobacteriaceae bacterium]
MRKVYFQADSYHTNDNTPRFLMDRLVLNTRLFFMAKFFAIVLKARHKSLRGQYDREAWAKSSINIFELIEGCGGKFHLTGLDNLRKCQGPVVFVSNHMSTLETMIFPCIIDPLKRTTFVIKDSLISHPFLGPVLRSINPIVVSRSNSREDLKIVMNQGMKLLSEGISIIIFPQNTRKVDFVPKEFNTLGVKLAAKAKVQVIPVAIKTDFWENGKYLKDLGPIKRSKPIHMAFGEPLFITGTGKEDNNQIIEFISLHLAKWNDQII